jgi:drug/metabolite transporter (DMT)-like permease
MGVEAETTRDRWRLIEGSGRGCGREARRAASGKWLGMAGYPVAAITWSRYMGHLLLVLALFVPTRGLRVLHTQSPGRQLLRGALMVTVSLLYFAAVRSLPLAQATAVFFTTPMLVTLFATVFLKERPGWATWLAVAGGFLGVMIVVRPGASLPLHDHPGMTVYSKVLYGSLALLAYDWEEPVTRQELEGASEK